MTADELIRLLDLAPLPVEGGFFRETYRSAHSTAIYYLLTPETCSLMHRLRFDEVYHFYAGDPLELVLLGEHDEGRVVIMGADLAGGMTPQQLVPAGTWQGSRLRDGGRFALLGTTVSPPFDLQGFELGARPALLDRYPRHAAQILALTKP